MIKKDKKHKSKSTLLKNKIQASPNNRFGLNKKFSDPRTLDHYNRLYGSSRQEFKNQRIQYIFVSSSTCHHYPARNKAYWLMTAKGGDINHQSSYPLGLFFCQFQLSRHISSMPYCASQPSSAFAFAGLQ